MKIIFSFLLVASFFVLTNSPVFAQNLTIILLRHAEKDTSKEANKDDPDLTEAGKQRAERLVETIKKYRPTEIYSTSYKRARATAAPLAEKINPRYRIQIQNYEHNELEELVERLLKTKTGTIVVVGHNTTTPTLANLLIKSDKYEYLQDSEYDKIWIIRIKGKKVKDQVIKY